MFKKIILFVLVSFFISCTKKQLKETSLSVSNPIEQQLYHKGDTVFITGEISYSRKIKNIGFFVALVDTIGLDSTFYSKTILPLQNPYKIQEYYVNDFNEGTHVLMSYGKRNVKTGQIYEIKELNLKFVP